MTRRYTAVVFSALIVFLVGAFAISRQAGRVQAAPALSAPTAAPTAALPTVSSAVSVQFTFKAIQQGRAGLVVINGGLLSGASLNALNHTYPCFPTHTGLACLLAVPMDTPIKSGYPIMLTLTTQDGSTLPVNNSFAVSGGGFLAETLNLPRNLLYMLQDDVQANEDTRLLAAYNIITPTRYWEGAFTPPVKSVPTSPFGGIRNYNGIANRRHTGQDFRAVVGTPVLASASGRVVLSRLMDIHGNNVVIDHGWGIYTEYAHMSERYVVPGQFVLQGQIIGLSGNTGRSTGPHIHWEIAVAGVWVDPLDFAQMSLPPA